MNNIRLAIEPDLHMVSGLWAKMVREELGNEPDRDAWESTVRHELFTDKYFFMFLAFDGAILAGFIMGNAYYEPSDSKLHGISQHIYVLPEYRHTGVSIKLYHTLAKKMKSMGVKIMSLYCIPSRMEFWSKKGFSPVQTMFSKELKNA